MTFTLDSSSKKLIITNELTRNYDQLQSQCSVKVRSYHVFKNLDSNELLSDIMFDFLIKLENPEFIDRVFTMHMNHKLLSFIGKTIDNQAKYTTAPFLQKKVKKFNETEFRELYYTKTTDEDEIIEQNKEDELINETHKLLERIEHDKILGEYSFYYVRLFTDYIENPKITYKELSRKYKISLATINRDMLYIKKCIIILLRQKGIQFPKNRKPTFNKI